MAGKFKIKNSDTVNAKSLTVTMVKDAENFYKLAPSLTFGSNPNNSDQLFSQLETKMDSPRSFSSDRNTRNNILNILTELDFKDTPESRKLDPWMTTVLAHQEQQEACSANNPLNNHHNTNIKKRSFNDLDSISPEQNDNCSFVGKPFKKQRNATASAPSVEKELPVQLRSMILGEMGGSDLLFVTEKALTRTDVSPGQSCFSIPERQVANQFLNIEEKANVKMGINVKLLICNHDYQPSSDEIKVNNINLTVWRMSSRKVYALNKTWNPIVKEHKLGQDMLVQLWAFRAQSRLYFALVKL